MKVNIPVPTTFRRGRVQTSYRELDEDRPLETWETIRQTSPTETFGLLYQCGLLGPTGILNTTYSQNLPRHRSVTVKLKMYRTSQSSISVSTFVRY